VVTNEVEQAIQTILNWNVTSIFVDNEAETKTGKFNCLTIKPLNLDKALVYYGSDVESNLGKVLKVLSSVITKSYCWDDSMEFMYPNIENLQNNYYSWASIETP